MPGSPARCSIESTVARRSREISAGGGRNFFIAVYPAAVVATRPISRRRSAVSRTSWGRRFPRACLIPRSIIAPPFYRGSAETPPGAVLTLHAPVIGQSRFCVEQDFEDGLPIDGR